MLETRATVLRIEGSDAFVQSNQSGCSNCQGKGCSTIKLSKMFSGCAREFRARNLIAAKVGDEVVVGVRDGVVLHGIARVYLLPLVLLFVGAGIAVRFAQTSTEVDMYAAAGALSGLVLGFAWVAWRHAEASGEPQVLRLWSKES